tara:strand:+ start:1098 stop:1547 length:450 start_codon:yes stop_codon:yes gene_type:complete
MKKNDSTKQVVAFYVAIVLLFVAVTIAVADNPVSRITAEPEWLDLNEEDDGKFAMMIDKGILCDKKGLIFNRYHSAGYISSFRGISKSGFETYILIRSRFAEGRYFMNEMVILEIDTQSSIACVISENTNAEYNEENIYLEIYPSGRQI